MSKSKLKQLFLLISFVIVIGCNEQEQPKIEKSEFVSLEDLRGSEYSQSISKIIDKYYEEGNPLDLKKTYLYTGNDSGLEKAERMMGPRLNEIVNLVAAKQNAKLQAETFCRGHDLWIKMSNGKKRLLRENDPSCMDKGGFTGGGGSFIIIDLPSDEIIDAGDSPSGGGSGGSGGGTGIIPIDDDEFDRLVKIDKWEREICKKVNFANNACLMEVWNALMQTNAAYEVLEGFLKGAPGGELCLDFKDLGTEINGNAVNQGAGTITVSINSNSTRMGRSKLSYARTILHELIHAELIRMVAEAGGYNKLQQFAANYQGDDPFMMIWEFHKEYDNYGPDNVGWQHEYMADYYVDYIASGLKQLHSLLSSQAFINYKTGSSVYDQQWSWDSFFNYIAWEGLHETEQFQDAIVNSGEQKYYKFYLQEAEAESQSSSCN